MQTLFSALIFMTGTGGSNSGIELYLSVCRVIMVSLSVCGVIMGLSCTLVLGRFSKNYKMFVRIRDIGRGRLC